MNNEFSDFDKETPWFVSVSKYESLTGVSESDVLEGGIVRSIAISSLVGIVTYIATNEYNSRKEN